ncbi:glycosyltransferase involved in cell wall biosynthesis [Sulfitobacter undariae]|uniref:Glycosyltransferase involved in cell wall biosynthesis n=1 Tax=Sulfitobacter undariae TaxID=1563671 RepID=A0A7W6H2K2_9RHOB|nr:glycosyltransferase family A protein [Sulfitobacter undariae]MBB3995898.1 glycosyltransferase involved in cell wall biosynthesis [Sulfitobacter undariae]
MTVFNVPITIIVTAYNSATYIDDCLSSIERQDIPHLEVIILDDGSSDALAVAVAPYLERNRKWRYYSQPNHGVGFTRNRALLLAQGEYIGFLDSDDYVSDTMYSNLLNIAKKDDACVVFSNFNKWNEVTGEEITDRKDRYYEMDDLSAEERLRYIFGGRIFGMACSCIFKRSTFLNAGVFFPVRTYHEDIYVLPRIFANAHKISHSEEKGYIWRMREGSESHSINSRHITSILHALISLQDYIKSIGRYGVLQRSFTTYCIMYLNGLLRRILGSHELPENKAYLLDLLKSAAEKILSDKGEFVPLHEKSYGPFVDFFRSTEKKPQNIVNALMLQPLRTTHCDVVFFPHKLYHTITMLPIARFLFQNNYSVMFVNMSDEYADEGAFSDFDYFEFPVVKMSDFEKNHCTYSSSVVMNDWDVKCALPIVLRDNALGRSTFGIVEGIQDFWDMDTGRHRNAYQNVKYLIAAGEHDLRYFAAKVHDEVMVGGVPRIAPLLTRDVKHPARPTALINVNFTYGVLEAERDSFIKAAVSASRAAGFDPVISRHPQDEGDLSGYNVTDMDMHSAIDNSSVFISRFSTAIIESVAMGKPAIYYNPDIEAVDKFLHPLDAFEVCKNESELVTCLKKVHTWIQESNPLDLSAKVRKSSAEFLKLHCGIGVDDANPEKIAEFIASKTQRLQSSNTGSEPFFEEFAVDIVDDQRITTHKNLLLETASALLLAPEDTLALLEVGGGLGEAIAAAKKHTSDDDSVRLHFERVLMFTEKKCSTKVML